MKNTTKVAQQASAPLNCKPKPIRDLASSCIDAGLSVIPVRLDGSKAPDGAVLPKDSAGKPSWKQYQTTPATEQGLDRWFSKSGSGIGIVCGAVSGNLEVIDFDNHDVYEAYLELVAQDSYINSVVDRITQVSTPGGAHWYYRCGDGIEGNQKLAECAKEENADKQTLIETRGEGGYVIAADNPASIHPSGNLYEFAKGDYDSIPTINGDERALLLDLARSLNRKIVIETRGQDLQKNEDPDAPGNAYNEKGDWYALLTDHGWTKLFESGGTQHWQRPGKAGNKGASATLNHAGSGRLYVFSSNAAPFECGRGYSKFQAYALLEHKGDFNKAASQLIRDGYGKVSKDKGEEKQKQSQTSKLVELGLSMGSFVKTPDGDVYAKIQEKGRTEVWSVRSKRFAQLLGKRYYDAYKNIPSASSISESAEQIEGIAIFTDGTPEQVVYVRVGEADGKVYIDLANDDWQTVEISSEGYKVINNCPILFKRSADMLPLPAPTGGGSISDLRPFVNCSDDEFILLQGWLVGALNPSGPYPILEVCGEQGAAKSSLCRMVRILIDPNTADLETSPKTFDDVKLAAYSCHLLAYDNLSGLSPEMSDIFCGVSTGTNKRDRALYTNNDAIIYGIKKPVAWNGIDTIAVRGDLVERTIKVHLKKLSATERKPEAGLRSEFELKRAGIFGALCRAVSSALKNKDTVVIKDMPRMADFAVWVAAAESALETGGKFIETYNKRLNDEKIESIENDEFAQCVIQFVTRRGGTVTGTSSELLKLLKTEADVELIRSKSFPKTKLLDWLRRRQENFRSVGLIIETGRTNAARIITLKMAV